MRRAAFHTLGCKVNMYETDAMMQLLQKEGYEIVSFQEEADIYIINTCSVTNMADRKSRQMLHRAKKMNPNAVVVAVGCYVQAAPEQVLRETGVDILIGNNQKKYLAQILEDYFKGQIEKAAVVNIGEEKEYEELEIGATIEHTRAYLKVQDGCNQFCTYCIIPYVRGRIRSRHPQEVEQEIQRMAAMGIKEIVLTGIHLSSYGKDMTEESIDLIGLLERIHGIEGIERIRLGSMEPKIVTEENVARMAKLEKLCPHFHLSLQSGCEATLKRMNRHYTPEEYKIGCERLRRYFPNCAITTDVIVGFPGETEQEFEDTQKFLEQIHFFEMHVFKYSKRQGTAAAKMSNQVDESVKTKRSAILLEMERRMSMEYRRSWIGKPLVVLTEEWLEKEGNIYTIGHTREYVKVALPGRWESNQIIACEGVDMWNDDVVLGEKKK
ncbi:MAG: tRNA (N(6)-L-threonylcarbamoyladenosine(37)-C(2))-methylthiotransferase MtaB [Lachnospiraceae bacterium]